MADTTFIKSLLSKFNGSWFQAFKISPAARSAAIALNGALEERLLGGTAFPTAPVTGERYFRTDYGIEYYYDGTRWLSVNEYTLEIPPYGSLPGTKLTATTSPRSLGASPDVAGTDIWLESMVNTWYVVAPNKGPDYWNIGIAARGAANFVSFNTVDLGADKWVRTVTALNVARVVATDVAYDINATMVGAPGALYLISTHVTYRLVG